MSIQRATDAEGLFAHLGAPWIVVFQAEVGADDHRLLDQESALVARMAPNRRAEFTAGRSAARAALACVGAFDQALLIGPGGQPLWPSGVVGSITHTGRVAYAAVGSAQGTQRDDGWSIAIGIDAEERERIEPDLLPVIMTEAERSVWERLEPTEADAFASVTFSAKEALYKAQFALTGAWLGFEHVSREDRPTPPLGSQVDCSFVESGASPLDPRIERPLRARSLVATDRVFSAVVLRRPATRTRSS